jgi:hypothetical protein
MASRLVYKFATQPIQYLERALTLCLKTGDKQRLSEVILAMFELHARISEPAKAGTWPFLFDQLYNNKKIPLSTTQEDLIIAKLEEVLSSTTKFGGKEFNPFSAEAAAARLAAHYSRKQMPDHATRVVRAYGASFEKLAETATPTLAMGWLQPVYDAYLRAGLRDDAIRVQIAIKLKGERAHEDMKSISATVELPKEEMEQWLETVTDGGLELAMQRIAAELTTKISKARSLLQSVSTQAPLLATIGIQKIADSQVVAQVGSAAADREGRVI